MANIFTEINILRQEGKLHAKLVRRIRMMFAIAVLLLIATLFNLTLRDVHPYVITGSVALAFLGFLLGFYVFSQMNAINWNEEEEVVSSGKMDVVGFASLALYIAFEVGLRTYLKAAYPTYAIPLLLSTIFGTILGRAVGSLVEIHRVYLSSHKEDR